MRVSSNPTNPDNSCKFSNLKDKNINLSKSQVHQVNSHASQQESWNLYSEYADGGQEMSLNKSALWSNSAVKMKPDKYRFPAKDPTPLEGLIEYTPKQLYIYILNLIYDRLTPENYNLWCELAERDLSFP